MFPVNAASGYPQLSGFLSPELWSPRLLEKFYEFSVLQRIANTNWEGEIRNYGDKVNIRLRPDIAIRDYEQGQDLDVQTPGQNLTELLIDRGKYYNFLVEDVERAQSDIDFMHEWTEDAGQQMVEEINEVVLGEIYTDAAAENQGQTAGLRTQSYDLGATGNEIVLTANTVVDKISECAAVLSEHKIPKNNRWMVLPPFALQLIYASPIKNALIQGNDQDLLRRGYVGNLAGFEIFESNQLAVVDDGGENVTNIIFGHISALTFASQLVKNDVIKSERKFGHFARGLNVYGFNVVKPDAMGVLYARK